MDHTPTRNTPTIYGLKDPRHGMFCYVGQAVGPESRFRQHVDGKNYDGNYCKALWMEDMAKAGVRPELVILQECESFPEADKAEREWIRRLIEEDHPILNIAVGGAGTRSASKLRGARKRDWIELGYLVKSARDATLHSMCDLSGMLPQASKEVRLFEKALKALDEAKNQLDNRLCAEYPKWENVIKVFYGVPAEHFSALGEDHAEADKEARLTTMTKEDVQRIMDEVPGLNDFGIGAYLPRTKTPEERVAEIEKGRAKLLDSVDACNRVCVWLADVDRTQAINERVGSSYGLKHHAEKDIGYVTNGVFITAAIFCGFRYRVDAPNVWFGMSSRSLKAKRERRALSESSVQS
jgi:hypothetical protein